MLTMFKPSQTFSANKVSTGDTHDKSIENILKTTGYSSYLITKSGGRYTVVAGSIVVAESKKKEVESEVKSGQVKKDASDGRGRPRKRIIGRGRKGQGI